MDALTEELFSYQDEFYKKFSKRLIPDTNYPIIGVRVPFIKKLAKKYSANPPLIEQFLSENHTYYEEWFLHGILLGYIKEDLKELITKLELFLPHVDNWAICDSSVMNLKIINKHHAELLPKIKEWLFSDHPYTIRFAVVTLLSYFLGEHFEKEILDYVAKINSQHYYVKMSVAWLFSVALVKQYDVAISYFTNKELDRFTHNKALQKAIESFRISDDKKEFLKKLKI